MDLSRLPPELVELIVAKIHFSHRDLERCCLVSSVFRPPCQKRLFRRLAISFSVPYAREWACEAAANHFDAAPHLAEYAHQFVLDLSLDERKHPSAKIMQALERVLPRLTRTREIRIFAWVEREIPEHFRIAPMRAVLHWLAGRPRGATERLILEGALPLGKLDMHTVLTAASNLYLKDLSVHPSDSAGRIAESPGNSNALVELHAPNSAEVTELLLLPEFAHYMQSLRTLSLLIDKPLPLKALSDLCRAAADTLERIVVNEWVFEDYSAETSTEYDLDVLRLPLPTHLPHLRRLIVRADKLVSEPAFTPEWLLPDIAKILPESVTPALREVTIHVFVYMGPNTSLCPGPLPKALMRSLDEAFVKHPTLEIVTWVVCEAKQKFVQEEEALERAFEAAMKEAFPQTCQKGMLFVALEAFRDINDVMQRLDDR
uniref:F-box domain-containing protein n=1 Tax=Mycena chlorophos TaxID=658473 RepID=A0ABQ0LDS4_MYCCL|nr:predicted protein [Mycena chlorophos]